MRITNNMTSYGFLRSLNKSQQREYAIQEQLSDGKALHRPSDDPVKTVRSLRFNTNLSNNEQFTQNLQDGQSWMNSTDGAMSDLSSIMNKANELVISADNTKTAGDMNTIGKQVDEMINQIVSIGNTKIGDRYLFAGQNDSTQPFVRTTLKDPNSDKTQEVVVYNGDNSKISMPIQQGAVNPNQDSINLTGADVFGPVIDVYGHQTVSVLNRLLEIKKELGKTSTVSQTNQNGGIGTTGGNYTGEGYQNFDIRVDSADYIGRVMTASYSTDGGKNWIGVGATGTGTSLDGTANPGLINLPNGVKFNLTDGRKVSNSNVNGGAVNIVPGAPITTYQVAVGTVTAGQVQTATYQSSTDGGATWSTATAFAAGTEINTTDPTNTALRLPNGSVFNIATSVANNNPADTYKVDVNSSMNVTETAGTNGVTKVSALANPSYQVKFTGTTPLTGQITAASYSTDGGATWTAGVPVDSISNPNLSSITLPNGDRLNVNTSIKNNVNDIIDIRPTNKQNDVYSFRVPQTVFSVNASNPTGGTATLSGTYTGTGSTSYSIRTTSVGAGGHITGADYSIDGGSSWNSLSNYNVVQSNFAGGKATVIGSGIPATTLYQTHIDAVDANGKVIGASYSSSTDNGATWSGFSSVAANNISDVMGIDSSISTDIQLPSGQTINIAANKNNTGNGTPITAPPVAGDVYTLTPVAFPPVNTLNGYTILSLPNGLQLNVASKVTNSNHDSFTFQIPQGNGPDAKWLSAVATQYVQDDHNMQLAAHTKLGTRMSMYEMAGNVMQNEHYTITNDVSQNEDIDMAKAITDFTTSKTVYESALFVGAKIMTKSLVDFIS